MCISSCHRLHEIPNVHVRVELWWFHSVQPVSVMSCFLTFESFRSPQTWAHSCSYSVLSSSVFEVFFWLLLFLFLLFQILSPGIRRNEKSVGLQMCRLWNLQSSFPSHPFFTHFFQPSFSDIKHFVWEDTPRRLRRRWSCGTTELSKRRDIYMNSSLSLYHFSRILGGIVGYWLLFGNCYPSIPSPDACFVCLFHPTQDCRFEYVGQKTGSWMLCSVRPSWRDFCFWWGWRGSCPFFIQAWQKERSHLPLSLFGSKCMKWHNVGHWLLSLIWISFMFAETN